MILAAMDALRHTLANANLDPEAVTVVIRAKDEFTRKAIIATICAELDTMMLAQPGNSPNRAHSGKMKICGIPLNVSSLDHL